MRAADDAATPPEPWWEQPRESWPRRLIVMRHATHSNGELEKAGKRDIDDVAGALAEWCFFTGVDVESFDAFAVSSGVTKEVIATKRRMRKSFKAARELLGGDVAGPYVDDLDPALQPTYPPDPTDETDETDETEETVETDETTRASKAAETAEAAEAAAHAKATRLVVLNEPQAGEFVNALSGATLELQRGELVLLEKSGHLSRVGLVPIPWPKRYRARWTMAPRVPKGDPLLVAVREKIAGKMRTAGVLGGLITSLLTFVLTKMFADQIRWGWATFAAFVALAVSSTLFFVAMFFYDSLTMPSQFWGQRAGWWRWHRFGRRPHTPPRVRDLLVMPVRWLLEIRWLHRLLHWIFEPRWLLARPPSATSRVLQLNMVRIWTWIFQPAILALGVGVGALLLALDDPAPEPATPSVDEAATTGVDLDGEHFGLLIAAGLGTAAWSWWFRPQIGASD